MTIHTPRMATPAITCQCHGIMLSTNIVLKARGVLLAGKAPDTEDSEMMGGHHHVYIKIVIEIYILVWTLNREGGYTSTSLKAIQSR